MQDTEKELMTSDTFGRTSLRQLAYYDQVSLSWKMYEDTLVLDSQAYLATLPKMGTMQDGKLYEQAMLVRLIKEQDYSLLPTPAARDYKGPGTRQMTLPMALLPTPTAMHVRNHDEPLAAYQQRVLDYKEGRTKGKPGASVGVAVRLLPTPTTQEGSGSCRDHRSDLTHPMKCACKTYRLHWLRVN